MAGAKLVMYTRAGCHLCDDMQRVVEEVARAVPLELRIVDVDSDENLRRLYDWEVPVLEVDGRRAFKYRVTVRELRRRLGV